MAGDWIKMRADLLTHPKVVRMMSALKADKFRIVGGLLSVWCLFDAHSEDGQLSGYTLELLDDMAAWPGFSQAMMSVGWLISGPESLELPRFDAHNGQSAKRRAQESDRKRSVRKASASDADKMRTREEKRREDIEEDKSSSLSEEKVTKKYSDDDFRFAEGMLKSVLRVAPKTKPPSLEKWADTVRLMREQDGITHSEMAAVFRFANQDPFCQ